jgi:hypothetical protein
MSTEKIVSSGGMAESKLHLRKRKGRDTNENLVVEYGYLIFFFFLNLKYHPSRVLLFLKQ